MNTVIRKLKADEVPVLAELFNYRDVDEMIEENTKDILNQVIDIFVMFDKNKPIGELRVKYVSDDLQEAIEGQRVYLYAYRIYKDYQNKGLGKQLLQYVINALEMNGYKEITVGVEEDNIIAKHIYQSFGFKKIIAHKSENYQGGTYEYDLLLRK